jgi:DNA-binding HxlR family transcriptional regulator
MTSRTYGQFRGRARALELVGERWGLLVVCDLVLDPKRFTNLRRGLLRTPPNILSAQLKEVKGAGVASQLTEYGQELEDIVLWLGPVHYR